MNRHPQLRTPQTCRIWLLRAVALLAAIGLQLVWAGVAVCASRCAKGACDAPLGSAATAPAEDCGHSHPSPAAPAKHSGNAPHGRQCPASHLRYWSASVRGVSAAPVRVVQQTLAADVLASPVAGFGPLLADARFSSEQSPPVIVPATVLVPLRI